MRILWLYAALGGVAAARPLPTQSVSIVVSAATPHASGYVDIHAVAGHPRLLSVDTGTVTATGVTASLPARLALPEGTELSLVGHDGLALRVTPDSSGARQWELTGPTIRLRYAAQGGGKARLVVLEATEGRITGQ